MLTPLDVQKKEFSKSIRGYNERDVDDYLLLIADALERHIKENDDLKEQIKNVEEKINRYRTIETTLSETLVVAKKTSDELVAAAKKQAEAIIAEAKAKAQEMHNEAERQVAEVKQDQMHMEKDLEAFRLRMESMLRSQLSVVENYAVDLK